MHRRKNDVETGNSGVNILIIKEESRSDSFMIHMVLLSTSVVSLPNTGFFERAA
jgi:hypothetical protein